MADRKWGREEFEAAMERLPKLKPGQTRQPPAGLTRANGFTDADYERATGRKPGLTAEEYERKKKKRTMFSESDEPKRSRPASSYAKMRENMSRMD